MGTTLPTYILGFIQSGLVLTFVITHSLLTALPPSLWPAGCCLFLPALLKSCLLSKNLTVISTASCSIFCLNDSILLHIISSFFMCIIKRKSYQQIMERNSVFFFATLMVRSWHFVHGNDQENAFIDKRWRNGYFHTWLLRYCCNYVATEQFLSQCVMCMLYNLINPFIGMYLC